MSVELAGVADIITGAAIARAIEPDAGEGNRHDDGKTEACLNCDASLVGAHCHSCGQKSRVHRTLHAFGHDILHSVLHFDGKIWRTLPLLFWNPGALTRRYVHGERAKFVSPIALFLFMVFLSFAAFSWIAPHSADVDIGKPVSSEQTAKNLANEKRQILDNISELEKEKKNAIATSAPSGSYGWIDGQIARNRSTLQTLENEVASDRTTQEANESKFAAEKLKVEQDIARLDAKLKEARRAGKSTTALEEELSNQKTALQLVSKTRDFVSSGGDLKSFDSNFFGIKSLNDAAKHAAENPQLLIYKIQSNAYKYSWALIPISVPFVWLLFFWRRQFKMFDHAVFVTYSLCFMLALGIVSGAAIAFSVEDSALFVLGICALVFLPPIHIYRQLHHAYKTTRFGAFWRMCILSVFAMTALTLFVALIVTLGVTG